MNYEIKVAISYPGQGTVTGGKLYKEPGKVLVPGAVFTLSGTPQSGFMTVTMDLADGTHNFIMTAVDAKGKESTGSPFSVTVDDEAPANFTLGAITVTPKP